jgi:hypothetical protein
MNKNVHNILVGKREVKRPLGDVGGDVSALKMYLNETVRGGLDWIQLVEDRF